MSQQQRPLAIVDIDGVVADVRHRVHHVDRRPKDWDAFFRAAADDPVHPEGLAVVEQLVDDHEVVFVTGRPEWLRGVTQTWLDANGLGGHRLLMRSSRDRAPARVVKPHVVKRLAKGREVGVVVDDDPEVVRAMAEHGWPSYCAGWEVRRPDPDAAMRQAQEADGRT